MSNQLVRLKLAAIVFSFHAMLLVMTVYGQSESTTRSDGWQERNTLQPIIQVAPPSKDSNSKFGTTTESENPAFLFDSPNGNQGSADSLTETGGRFLTDYFEELGPKDKAKFSWNLPGGWTIVPFGQLRGEIVYANHRTAADAVQFFYAPASLGVDDDSITIHGKTSMLNFALAGPDVNGWRTGGKILINFLGPQPLRNNSGFNVVNAYGEFKNDYWRFSFGRMVDLFSPIATSTVNMGQQRAAGNIGIFRGAFNVDRYIERSPHTIWSLSGRISQNTVNDFLLLPTARGTDNGIPNFEGRIGVAMGQESDGVRPFEIGVSGLWGETRAFDPARFDESTGEIIFLGALQNVSTTAGVNIDLQVRGPRVGLRGEFWAAQAAGTYFAGILQTLNSETGNGIRSIGGWVEVYYKYNRCTTFHTGGGIDDPRNQDVGFITNGINDPGQRLYNHVLWTNVMYDVTSNFQLGFEMSYRKTHYLNPLSGTSGLLTHFSSTLKF